MTQNEYEQKRAARIERLESAAERATDMGHALVNGAREMASVIPFGQPIMIGHHSEGRDRNYRGRIEGKFRKGFAELDKAEYYQRRAEAAANNTAIFSDDPSAAEKLEEKIARLEKRQDLMRDANKALRKALKTGDDSPLLDLGFSEKAIAELKTPDFCGRIGFANYQLTNNSANIRRLKQRLSTVQANANREEREYSIGQFRIVENPSENRVQLFFPKELLPKVKDRLKAHGFRFSWENTCWQRHLSNGAIYEAKEIAKSCEPPTLEASNCCAEFKATLAKIAAVAGITAEAVYQFWREYSKSCETSDQSAVLGEFVSWYREKLGGDVNALMEAARA